VWHRRRKRWISTSRHWHECRQKLASVVRRSTRSSRSYVKHSRQHGSQTPTTFAAKWRRTIVIPLCPLLSPSSSLPPKGHCEQEAMRDEGLFIYVAGHPLLCSRPVEESVVRQFYEGGVGGFDRPANKGPLELLAKSWVVKIRPPDPACSHGCLFFCWNWHFILVFTVFGVLLQGGQMEAVCGSRSEKSFPGLALLAITSSHTHWRFNFYAA